MKDILTSIQERRSFYSISKESPISDERIEELVSEVTGMFAGGELSEDAIEGAYKALTDAYWIAKENNKKYAPKTRRKKSDQ